MSLQGIGSIPSHTYGGRGHDRAGVVPSAGKQGLQDTIKCYSLCCYVQGFPKQGIVPSPCDPKASLCVQLRRVFLSHNSCIGHGSKRAQKCGLPMQYQRSERIIFCS